MLPFLWGGLPSPTASPTDLDLSDSQLQLLTLPTDQPTALPRRLRHLPRRQLYPLRGRRGQGPEAGPRGGSGSGGEERERSRRRSRSWRRKQKSSSSSSSPLGRRRVPRSSQPRRPAPVLRVRRRRRDREQGGISCGGASEARRRRRGRRDRRRRALGPPCGERGAAVGAGGARRLGGGI